MQSEHINELAAALAAAQGEMQNAPLNKVNPHFKSRYADLAAIRDATVPCLTKHGLAIVQQPHMDGYLLTTLVHSSGQWMASSYPIPMTGRPQEIGSALTYARRYSWQSMCAISAEDDDDANAAQESTPRGNGTSRMAPKRTQAEISARAAEKAKTYDEVMADLRHPDITGSSVTLERYVREHLTPDTMAKIGPAQIEVENVVQQLRDGFAAPVDDQPDEDGVLPDVDANQVTATRLKNSLGACKDEADMDRFKRTDQFKAAYMSLPAPLQVDVRNHGERVRRNLRDHPDASYGRDVSGVPVQLQQAG